MATMIDGDLCGFISVAPPPGAEPTAIGVSEPGDLTAIVGPFRRATRALEAASAFGAGGIFD
jgi:hypothetical protein